MIVPYSKCFFHEYHVLVDTFIFIGSYVLFSALTVRVLIKVSPLEIEEYGFATIEMTSKKAFYWKILTSVTMMGGMYFLPFVPLFVRPHFFSLFGAKIGNNAEIAGNLAELPLITIEEFAFIGGDTFITAHAVIHNLIILKPVKISSKSSIQHSATACGVWLKHPHSPHITPRLAVSAIAAQTRYLPANRWRSQRPS